MNPIDSFESVWTRCHHLTDLHAYLDKQNPGVLNPEELLRAELAARVAALDLYIHELVAQGMIAIFEGRRQECIGYFRFEISSATLKRIMDAGGRLYLDAVLAFDYEVRKRLGHRSFQKPEKIADGIRMISDVQLWRSVAHYTGVNEDVIKKDLSLIVDRRNRIVHSGDMVPGRSGDPSEINVADLEHVTATIEKVVRAIDRVV